MLTLQFVPYHEISGLSQAKKIRKLLDIVKEDKVVLMEGRLRVPEEAELIKETMAAIDERFSGIEISVISPEAKNLPFLGQMRNALVNALLGEKYGLTVIGPATIVKEIKKDPNKIQLLLSEENKRKKKGRK
jgi:hypothetical protein